MGATKQQDPATDVLDGFVPGSTLNEAQVEQFDRMAKYEYVKVEDGSGPSFFRLEEGTDIVAVADRRTGWTGVIHRMLVKSIDVGGGKTKRIYRIVGLKATETAQDALEVVRIPQAEAREQARQNALEALGELAPTAEAPF